MRSLIAAVAVVALSSPATAAWNVAQSKHFIIYANQRPKALADFATKLERFDYAARTLLRMDDFEVGDGNRLTIYSLPSAAAVQKLAGDTTGFLGGFYTGRVEGPLAYVAQRMDAYSDLEGGTILFHEYAHHLMMQQFDQPYPEWYVEGFAEFLSTPVFGRDGSLGLGAPPKDSAASAYDSARMPLDRLLGETYGPITKLPREQREALYFRAWLLTHYLTMEPTRSGQLHTYFQGIAQGKPAAQSATAAFGDLKQLDNELNVYVKRRTVRIFKVRDASTRPVAVDVRPLSLGAAEIILIRGTLKNGKAEPEAIAEQVRSIEARHRGDELVEITLAEAEINVHHLEAAEAAADRAIAANSKNTEALVLKGRALVERARDAGADERAKLFSAARQLFVAANKIDPEDPEPLMQFYMTFMREGKRPTPNALAALHHASDLAPQDYGVRLNSALAYLQEGKTKEARQALVAVAYSPHAEGAADAARRMIARIDAGDAQGAIRTAVTN